MREIVVNALIHRDYTIAGGAILLAEVFHRAGLIEKWGRGTNRVAEMCRAAGIPPPDFAEIGGAAVVTFKVPVSQFGPGAESGAETLEQRVLMRLEADPRVAHAGPLGGKR